MTDNIPTALVVGVGEATGSALCRALVVDHRVAMVARSQSVIEKLANDSDNCMAFQCDVANSEQWMATLSAIEQTIGIPDKIIFNTEGGGGGTYDQVNLDAFDNSFAITVASLLRLAQLWLPKVIETSQSLQLLISSSPVAFGDPLHMDSIAAPSNQVPISMFTGLGPSRAAQRFLAEAIKQSTQGSSIDIGILAIDGPIDEPKMRQMLPPDYPDSSFIKPQAIAAKIMSIFATPGYAFRHDIRAED